MYFSNLIRRILANRSAIRCDQPMNHHLMIIKSRFLAPILSGRKCIECRLAKTQIPPFKKIAVGDILWIKPASQPILARAIARRISYHDQVTPQIIRDIQDCYGPDIAADESFFDDHVSANFGTILQLADVRTVEPIPFAKSDRRPWVVLSAPPPQPLSMPAVRLQHD